MKKIFALILAAVLLSTEVSSAATVFYLDEAVSKKESEVKIAEDDKQALTALIAQQRAQGAVVSEDLYSDEYVWNSETGKLQEIKWAYKYLKGDISFSSFTELVKLDCAYNPITSLDLQGCQKLETLDCSDCDLEQLDLNNNLKLNNLYCHGNKISSLDLNFTTSLGYVNCSDNGMKTLQMEKVTYGASELHCHGNKLKTIGIGEEVEGEYYVDDGVAIEGQVSNATYIEYISTDSLLPCSCYKNDDSATTFIEGIRTAKKAEDTQYPQGSEVVVETKQELYDVIYYLTEVGRKLDEFPSIVVKNYDPDKFYLGEVLYEINQNAGKKRRYIISNPNDSAHFLESSTGYKGSDFDVSSYMENYSYELLTQEGELPDAGIIVKNKKELRKKVIKAFSKKEGTLVINQLYSYPLGEIMSIINYATETCKGANSSGSESSDTEFYMKTYSRRGIYSEAYAMEGFVENGYKKLAVVYVTDYSKKEKKLHKKADKVVKKIIKKGMSDKKKATVIHDYLIKNCQYYYGQISFTSEKITAYGALIQGKCVCQGYAEAFELLAQKAGLKTYFITAPKMNHAFNMVSINGQIRYVDVTWDDTGSGGKHQYLLRTEKQMKKSHTWDVKKYKKAFKKVYQSPYSKLYKTAFTK